MNKNPGLRSDCPISTALDIFGDKWSLLIIRNLMFYNMNTYGEFIRMPENIATNILADRLVSLEKAGIILKEEHPESKAKFFYKLTSKGIDLVPLMLELTIWGGKHYEINPYPKAVINDAIKNKEEFVKKLSARLKKIKP
jgi:DNA-binding HxlR family transcriptional regulator